MKDEKAGRWLVKRCGCHGGRDNREGELCSDSGYVLEGQLSVLAGRCSEEGIPVLCSFLTSLSLFIAVSG